MSIFPANGSVDGVDVGMHISSDKYKLMLDTLPQGAALMELDPGSGKSTCLYANDAYCDLCNCTREQLYSHGISAINQNLHPDDRESALPLPILVEKNLLPYATDHRIYYGEVYKWRHGSVRYTANEHGKLYMSCVLEDYTRGAQTAEAAQLLTSFITTLFDASCYVDENLAIVDYSPQLRDLLGYKESFVGVCLSDYIVFEKEKDRFRMHMCLEPDLAAPMIKVRMALAAGSIDDVQLYTTNIKSEAKYLVGLRVIREEPEKLFRLQTLCRDLVAALQQVRLICTDANLNLPCFDDIVPLFSVSDGEMVEEEVIKWLPNNIQWDMFEAARSGNFLGVAQLLEYTVDGCGNFFMTTKRKKNKAVHHSAFRFYLDMVPRLPPTDGHQLLYMLDEAMLRLEKRNGGVVLGWELTLCLLTAAYKNPQCYANSMQWLRERLTKSLKSNSVDNSKCLGPVYWICILWGALQLKFDRKKETLSILEQGFADMQAYCLRHPESGSVRQLQAIAAHNLSVEYLRGGIIAKALEWANKIQAIQLTSQVKLPSKCNQLVVWAERIQDQFYTR